MGQLEGRTALITGASRGIGRAVAELFAREGARVALTARDAGLLRRVCLALPGKGHAVIPADLASPGQVARLAGQTKAWCGGVLDILVNNASVLGPLRPCVEIRAEEFAAVLQVNLTAVFDLTTRLIPLLESSRHAVILNVTSSAGRVGRASWGPYSASKFGIESLTQTWAQELAPRGIRTVAINPGGTRTRMRAEAHPEEDPKTVPPPEEVARAFLAAAIQQNLESGSSFDARDPGWQTA